MSGSGKDDFPTTWHDHLFGEPVQPSGTFKPPTYAPPTPDEVLARVQQYPPLTKFEHEVLVLLRKLVDDSAQTLELLRDISIGLA